MQKKYCVGIDLGGTSIKLGVIDESGNIVNKHELPTPKKYEDTLSLFEQMIYQTGVHKKDIAGVGVGVPGFVDIDQGLVRQAVNIGWHNVPLKFDLETKIQLPVLIDNDANLAALGEMWQGAGKGSRNLLCVTIGTGIGGGVIIDGKIYHGKNAMAGEIGHVPINPKSKNQCNCGGYGCLETEVSATAMVKYNKKAIESGRNTILSINSTTKDIFAAAKRNDELAIEIIDNTGYYLGLALSQISSVIAPEKIVIGGGVSRAKELILEPVQKYFRQFSTLEIAEQTEIVLAELGNDAGIVGAAWLAASNTWVKKFE